MDDLNRTLREIRVFAYRMWRHCDPKRPIRQASAGYCDPTAQLVTVLLNRHENRSDWATVSGNYVVHRMDHFHCWTQHEDGRIIDLTADQFGDQKIVISKHPDARYHYRDRWIASCSDLWIPYYDIWVKPPGKRRLSIKEIQRILNA